jgi:hypothetical protein
MTVSKKRTLAIQRFVEPLELTNDAKALFTQLASVLPAAPPGEETRIRAEELCKILGLPHGDQSQVGASLPQALERVQELKKTVGTAVPGDKWMTFSLISSIAVRDPQFVHYLINPEAVTLIDETERALDGDNIGAAF